MANNYQVKLVQSVVPQVGFSYHLSLMQQRIMSFSPESQAMQFVEEDVPRYEITRGETIYMQLTNIYQFERVRLSIIYADARSRHVPIYSCGLSEHENDKRGTCFFKSIAAC